MFFKPSRNWCHQSWRASYNIIPVSISSLMLIPSWPVCSLIFKSLFGSWRPQQPLAYVMCDRVLLTFYFFLWPQNFHFKLSFNFLVFSSPHFQVQGFNRLKFFWFAHQSKFSASSAYISITSSVDDEQLSCKHLDVKSWKVAPSIGRAWSHD